MPGSSPGRGRARRGGTSGSRLWRRRGPARSGGSARLGDLATPGLGAVEELASAGQGGGTASVATEHLSKLDDPALAVEVLDLGDRSAVSLALRDPVVGIGVSRDLREMGHAQDLVASGQRP